MKLVVQGPISDEVLTALKSCANTIATEMIRVTESLRDTTRELRDLHGTLKGYRADRQKEIGE